MTGPDELPCIDAVEQMTDLLEDALPAQEARRLGQHLDWCTGCEGHLAQLRTVARSLADLPRERLSDRARAELMAAFRRDL